MPAFTLDEVLQAPGARLVASGAEHFDDVVTDTRKIERGCLFIALRGERFNGEDFALDAAADGAVFQLNFVYLIHGKISFAFMPVIA